MTKIEIELAEKDIKYVFKSFLKLSTEIKDLKNMAIFFNNDNLASGFVKQRHMSTNEFNETIKLVGKKIKPKLILMVGDGQITIAHLLTKITSIFVKKDGSKEWEEVW